MDRNFWSMIHNNHYLHERAEGRDLRESLNEHFGYKQVHDFYGDAGANCSTEFECEWVDCEEHEIRGDDHCWREDCHSECGEFECVLWHWNVEAAVWDEEDCGIEAVMDEFNGHAYEHYTPQDDAAQAFGFENLQDLQNQLPNETEI